MTTTANRASPRPPMLAKPAPASGRDDWRTHMRAALSDVAAGLHGTSERGPHIVGDTCQRVAQRLIAGRTTERVRDPQTILAEWRAVEGDENGTTSVPVRDAVGSALRAEYASAIRVRSDVAARLMAPFDTYGGALQDPRAADVADELVEALWRDAATRARLAFSKLDGQEADKARKELTELRAQIAGLELDLHERPWTEES